MPMLAWMPAYITERTVASDGKLALRVKGQRLGCYTVGFTVNDEAAFKKAIARILAEDAKRPEDPSPSREREHC